MRLTCESVLHFEGFAGVESLHSDQVEHSVYAVVSSDDTNVPEASQYNKYNTPITVQLIYCNTVQHKTA